MSDPVVWYKSQRFIALCQSSALCILGWLTVALTTDNWSWRATAATLLTNIALQLKDWWSPNVIAPLTVLNKNNAGVP